MTLGNKIGISVLKIISILFFMLSALFAFAIKDWGFAIVFCGMAAALWPSNLKSITIYRSKNLFVNGVSVVLTGIILLIIWIGYLGASLPSTKSSSMVSDIAKPVPALEPDEAEREFKASRAKILKTMKDFARSSSYASAAEFGYRYSAVKDKQFQKLYIEAVRQKEKQEAAAQQNMAKQNEDRILQEAFKDALDGSGLSINSKVLCEEGIKNQLRSPSTADFPWSPGKITAYPTGKRLVYSSYVDSQNGFGAIIRTNFACTLHYKGGDVEDIDNWAVKDIQTY